MGKNKQNGESENKSDKKNQKSGDSSVDYKSDKKNQCKEIVLKVYMHCEGCASQVSHCLRGYDGVEQIKTEIGDNKVVVSGKFDDPLKILRRVQKKFSKNAELISPKPNPKQDQKKEPQQKKESAPEIKTAILKMNMHCEGCVHEIKRGIEKIKGIQSVEPDRSKSTVVVRGVMDPPKLVEKIKKKLGKHAELLSQTTEKGKDNNNNNKNNHKNEDSDGNKIFSYPPQYSSQHAYPSQIFSDENVHSCSIM
ncbi:Heavy metal-associated domain superfamily [Arabidopsis suecica]|uniref:Heavy metal-associated domain superfamily n=1 Tax=Arabidopsis suecica TaxID=45249 RepID=A0A8T2B0Q8_ARASU|nr:Heavy metal-associated domain superfamily [Arabidopsis suecica]